MSNQNEDREREQLKREMRRHRIGLIIVIVVCVLAVISVSIYGWYLYNNQNYESKEIKQLQERSDGGFVRYLSYNSGQLLKYSRDGAMAMDGDGTILWNGSYEFANPIVATCGSYVVIADEGGTQACIYNGQDTGRMIDVIYPIAQVSVAGQGVVALLLEDSTSDVIQMYNPYSNGSKTELLVEVPTNVQQDGFSTDIALSTDGTKLVTSMVRIVGGSQENYVNFYNFSEVGENNINRLVGARSFNDNTVNQVRFLNNDVVCVETSEGISLYSMKQVPNDIKDFKFKKDIKSIFSSDTYLGVVLTEESEDIGNYVTIYDFSGEKIYKQKIGFEYIGGYISGKELVLYGNSTIEITRLSGKRKFKGDFDTGITDVFPVDNFETYLVLDQSNIQQMKLK